MKFSVALAAALLAAAATAVVAQPQPAPPAAASSSTTPVRPAAATASATAASGGAGYRSAFEGYRRYDNQPVGSWREANELVGRIGGWQAYAREGQGEGHDMGAMKNMPGMSMAGMEAKSGDASAGKGGAAGHDMGSMKTMPGMNMPGSDSKPAAASAGHDMGSMKKMPGMGMPGMNAKPADASSRKESPAGHDMGSMKNMPSKAIAGGEGAAAHDMNAMKDMPGQSMAGMSKPAVGESMGKEGHDAKAMGKGADDSAGKGRNGPVVGTGVVQGIDKANGKVKLTHDPIAALGWPRMTMFFRLKESALAEKVKEGDAVAFSLEKSISGFVISGLERRGAQSEGKQTK